MQPEAGKRDEIPGWKREALSEQPRCGTEEAVSVGRKEASLAECGSHLTLVKGTQVLRHGTFACLHSFIRTWHRAGSWDQDAEKSRSLPGPRVWRGGRC